MGERRVNPDQKPVKALWRFLKSWPFITVLFAGCLAGFWSKIEGTPIGPYLIAVGFGVCGLLASLRIFKKRSRWIRFGIPVLIAVVGVGIAHAFRTDQSPPVSNAVVQWEPPELPPGCSNITIKLGSQMITMPTPLATKGGTKIADKEFLRLAEIEMTISGRTFKYPIIPFVKNNRLYVSVLTPNQMERQMISMDRALDKDLPPLWDRNFTSNAFEIVREDKKPILQVVYRRAEVVEVYGVFVLDTNHVLVTFGPTNSLWLQGITAGATNITVDSTAFILQTAAFDADFTEAKSIFKYPSWKYLGIIAE